MKNIRKEIASRLKYEFGRRGLTPALVSAFTEIPFKTISDYLTGEKEIVFDEVSALCKPYGINSVRLLFGNEYPKTNLAFRNIKNEIQEFTSKVEDVFLLIEDFLPEINVPKHQKKLIGSYKRHEVIQEVGNFAKDFRKKFKEPESFLKEFNIPVIPIQAKYADFDAFIVSKGQKSAICINTNNRPPHRLIFSLAHEICHLLFDRNEPMAVDVMLPNLYWDQEITNESLPEFFAYKFAQFYLVPYDVSIVLSKKYPNLNLMSCQKVVDRCRTLKEVLINALYDTLSSNQELYAPPKEYGQDKEKYLPSGDQFRRMDDQENRDLDHFVRINEEISKPSTISFKMIKTQLEGITPSKNAVSVYSFLEERKEALKQCIIKNVDSFSDDVIEYIKEILQIEF